MSRGMCFSYGGFHFIPVRQFEKDEGDFFALSKRLEIDPALGLSAYKERQKFPYTHKDFYAATADKTCDIVRCLENGRLYVPGERELFIYHDPYSEQKIPVEIKDSLMLIDTATRRFDMRDIDNRRFMYEPKTGVLILGEQYGKVKGLPGSHAEDLAKAGITAGYDDYVRGWVGPGREYPKGVIHFAPNMDEKNIALFNRAFDTLEMFRENGAGAETVVRAFGKRWEQPLFAILNAPPEREQKPSVKERLKQKPEQHARPKQTPKSKKKEAEL